MNQPSSMLNFNTAIISTDSSCATSLRTESDSSLGDSVCVQPLLPQHLCVDFTPLDNVDTELVQKKCCSFWEFIKQCPELQGMVVKPQLINYRRATTPTPTSLETVESIPCSKTALSILEFVEEKGLMDHILQGQLPQSGCSIGSRDYENEPPKIQYNVLSKQRKSVYPCKGTCKSCSAAPRGGPASSPLKNLCKEMQNWDSKHPKSMDPPGLPPAFRH